MSTLQALLEGETLASPKIGVFRPASALPVLAAPGAKIGTLKVLGKSYTISCPAGVQGVLHFSVPHGASPVEYGQKLGTVEAHAAEANALSAASKAEKSAGDALVAPIHGVFYRRASPSSAAYVEIGAEVKSGQTIGLIEVMKTFHPVVYDEDKTRGPGRVVKFLVGEQAEVEAGQPLCVIEPK